MQSPGLLLCLASVLMQVVPRPPCGIEPVPAYPGLDSPPAATFWSESEFGRDWRPPACTGWTAIGFSTLTTTTGQFRYMGGSDGLLRRIGAISDLGGIRYWSTTHKQWQPLIVSAHALNGAQPDQRRGNFTLDEMKQGQTLYFEQTDNLSGRGVYRLHLAEVSPARIVYSVENVSAMRYLFMTTFHPGDLQTIYFLDRESEIAWKYYSIVRTGRNASRLTTGHAPSSINRAVAFYRHLAGIPTDQEPPAAR